MLSVLNFTCLSLCISYIVTWTQFKTITICGALWGPKMAGWLSYFVPNMFCVQRVTPSHPHCHFSGLCIDRPFKFSFTFDPEISLKWPCCHQAESIKKNVHLATMLLYHVLQKVTVTKAEYFSGLLLYLHWFK